MIGVLANGFAIVLGGVAGTLLGKRFKEKFSTVLLKIMGIFIIILGLQSALQMSSILRILVYLALGTLIGELFDIEKRLEMFVKKFERQGSKSVENITNAFVTATLVYCVGSFSIIALVKAGMIGDNSILYTKAVLDGVVAVILASTMGVGIIYSSIAVVLYQGSITLFSSLLKDFVVTDFIGDLDSVGGILIVCIGLKMSEILDIRIGNLLPALFIPLIYHIMMSAM